MNRWSAIVLAALTSLDGMIGQRAIVSVDWEDDDRGGRTLKATEVRFSRAKKK